MPSKTYPGEEELTSSLSDEDAGQVYFIAAILVGALEIKKIRPSELVITALEMMLNRLKRDLRS